MLDVLGEDYVRTARAKGISERRVVYRQGLRSALTPVVTQFGIDLGTLLGGIMVTETVLGLPGLGQQIYKSISRQDLPVIIGLVLLDVRAGRQLGPGGNDAPIVDCCRCCGRGRHGSPAW